MKEEAERAGLDEREVVTTSWWPELVELVEHVEAEVARRQGRPPRPASEICAAIEREWLWRSWRRPQRR